MERPWAGFLRNECDSRALSATAQTFRDKCHHPRVERDTFRHNALGQADSRLTPHPVYQAIAAMDNDRQAHYRALFRAELDQAAIDDIRLALNQNQPLGNDRFHAKIERLPGERREAKPRGRPRLEGGAAGVLPGPRKLEL